MEKVNPVTNLYSTVNLNRSIKKSTKSSKTLYPAKFLKGLLGDKHIHISYSKDLSLKGYFIMIPWYLDY